MTTPLSPAAQAVLDAINKALDEAPWDVSFLAGASAAAALRAINEYVVLPKYQYAEWKLANAIHQEIEAIADELEAL